MFSRNEWFVLWFSVLTCLLALLAVIPLAECSEETQQNAHDDGSSCSCLWLQLLALSVLTVAVIASFRTSEKIHGVYTARGYHEFLILILS
jgi:hypothetical protein